jgi:RluA family pseudouridine synthase
MMSNQLPIVNIAAYKFASLTDLAALRQELRQLTKQLGLRGTILLSTEGINLFVAGGRDAIDALLDRLRQVPGLEDLPVKESFSRELPFRRMLVKIKREIIAFGIEGIEPARYTSRRLSAVELKAWLDEGRPVTLLDTRNDFEYQTGTFKNALAIGIEDFRDFPKAVRRLPETLKEQPIVTFCTGGIRCEKAAPYLEREGFRDVYQLDGGILKYFEECGGAHYEGDCFVFDYRVALDPTLNEASARQCFVCQSILTAADQASPYYVPGKSCPHCYQSAEQKYQSLLAARHAAIQQITRPLPGSIPYENERPITVPLRFDGLELLDFLDAMKTHLPRTEWERICREGRLTCQGVFAEPGRRVRAGERWIHRIPATVEPPVNPDIRILHEDEALVVIQKPAPLPMHPCGRFHRNSLTYILDQVYSPLHPRPAHRLDADTTGVVVLGKTRDVNRRLQPQFERGEVHKVYLARVIGHPETDAFECDMPIRAEPGDAGVRLPDGEGQAALTRFRCRLRLADGTALLDVYPVTGRTNQIRAHLWHLGLPIQGDPIYLPNRELGSWQSSSQEKASLCLHAAEITIVHPLTKERVTYSAPLPAWARG